MAAGPKARTRNGPGHKHERLGFKSRLQKHELTVRSDEEAARPIVRRSPARGSGRAGHGRAARSMQTRQRNSPERARARASSAGSRSISRTSTASAGRFATVPLGAAAAKNAAIPGRPRANTSLANWGEPSSRCDQGAHSAGAAGASVETAHARTGSPSRRRRSDSDSAPPAAIAIAPSQISKTSGFQ